jgi:DNA-binding FrmR family transcriptional regulator
VNRHAALRSHPLQATMTMAAALMPNLTEPCSMTSLADERSRKDLLNRLKRAEGQLRGIQRMIEEGAPCLDIAGQMAAVRKALESTYVRMTVCFMEQELSTRVGESAKEQRQLGVLLDEVQALLGKVR